MDRRLRRGIAILAGLGWAIALCPGPALAQAPHREQLAAKLRAELQKLADEAPGVVGIAAVDVTTGERFGVNEDLVFPQGSAIKIPILIELFRRSDEGDVVLGDRVAVGAADQVGGSGLLQHFEDGGSELSLHDLAVAMIVLSDNTATNLLIDRLGMEQVNGTMAELGAAGTRLQRKMIRPEESLAGNENLSTPAEAADLMVRLAGCDLPLTPESCAAVRRILEIGKPGAFREPIPAEIPVAWKPGSIDGVQTAWGLVDLPGGPYAVSVMVNYGPDDIDRTVRDVSAAVYRYFTQIARATAHGIRVSVPDGG